MNDNRRAIGQYSEAGPAGKMDVKTLIQPTGLHQVTTMPKSNGPNQGTRKKLRNDPRERGTSPPQQQVEQFEAGDHVHLDIDPSVPKGRFHPRFNGLTGTVEGRQGRAYKVAIRDGGKQKTVVTAPAHLRRQG